jgi:hypothetical protein
VFGQYAENQSAWNKTQLCAEQFPKPIRVGKKTTSTLCGLTDEDFVQVTSSPHIIVIPMRFKHRLCRKLNDFGVIVSEATTPEEFDSGASSVRLCARVNRLKAHDFAERCATSESIRCVF